MIQTHSYHGKAVAQAEGSGGGTPVFKAALRGRGSGQEHGASYRADCQRKREKYLEEKLNIG